MVLKANFYGETLGFTKMSINCAYGMLKFGVRHADSAATDISTDKAYTNYNYNCQS